MELTPLIREAKVEMPELPPLKVYLFTFNPLYSCGLFHCYMLDESICQFRGVNIYFVTFILFLMENPVSKQHRP